MKFSTISVVQAFAVVSATPCAVSAQQQGSLTEWIPGGANDFRGPCPMMNTLANHGFLPRNGGNITRENAVYALTTALNFNASVANIMWEQAIFINPTPNATFFTLDHLNRHNVLEHDASISRSDAYFGNNHVFNQTVFDVTKTYWTGDVLNANMLAMGKVAQQVISKAHNPEYKFTSTTEAFSLGELAAPILIFGDIPAGTVKKDMVEFFFENERLPVELGWKKQATPISLDEVLATSQLISNATNLFTPGEAAAHKRRDLHWGFAM